MSDKDIIKRLREFVDYAEATNKFADAGFYNDVISHIHNLAEKAEAELQEKLRQQRYDDIEYFGAYLVDNYESAFSGGEDEIRQVCSNMLSLLNAKIDD